MQHDPESALSLAKSSSLKRRSCDLCFKLREKCTWSNNPKECDRCRRIPRTCSSQRPHQPIGRKPRYLIKSLSVLASKLPPALHPFSHVFRNLDTFEEAVVTRFTEPGFFNELMTVPRVGRAMHQQAMYALLRSWDETRDGCFSMFGAFATAKSIELPGYDYEENLHRGTRALKTFRTMPCPTTHQDVMPWLWLGISVLIYAHCGLGYSGNTVRRYILYHLCQLGEQGREYASHPSIVSLIALDIHECLLHRRMPVMNFPLSDDVGDDTFLGLCAPLVRFSYQLASLSYNWGEGRVGESVLKELEASVEAWQPAFAPKWSQDLSILEATHVLSQARVHKTMMLLFAHRLRHPFGQEDATAQRMAHSIFSELDLATAATGEPPMWVMTPFLMAAMEATDTDERNNNVIRNLPMYGDKVSPKSRQLAQDFLEALWAYRDQKSEFRWIDNMVRLPPLCVYV